MANEDQKRFDRELALKRTEIKIRKVQMQRDRMGGDAFKSQA